MSIYVYDVYDIIYDDVSLRIIFTAFQRVAYLPLCVRVCVLRVRELI